MKKIFKGFFIFVFSLILLVGGAANVWAASASFTGPSTVRGGDTITLELKVNDNGKFGLEGALEFDSKQVSFSGVSTSLKDWKVEKEGSMVIAYDDTLTNPIKGNVTVVSFKFKVANDVAPGTKVKISLKNLVSTDGTNESSLGTVAYSVTIAKPLSNNSNLSSLSVAGLTMTPGFSAGTTSYNLGEVDYAVSKLDISYKTEDAGAKVAIKGNALNVGKNTISVVVTAENGSTKTYTLSVTRMQDPNYKASSNANLKSMTISMGMLSPIFSADVTEYILYLPYECVGTSFEVSGVAADSKAQSVTKNAIASLVEGKNETSVVCRAEDGTEKNYNIVVFVMPEYKGELPVLGDSVEDNDSSDNNESNESQSQEESSNVSEESSTEESREESIKTESDKESEESAPEQKQDHSGKVVILLIVLVVILAVDLVYVLFIRRRIN